MTDLRKILSRLKETASSKSFLNLRTVSTLSGIVLGVAALTASFNFCEAARREILKSIEGMTADIIVVKNCMR